MFAFADNKGFLTRLQDNYFYLFVMTTLLVAIFAQSDHLRVVDSALYSELSQLGWDSAKNRR